jgi:prepilin-type N-terminal cleavage/methylation domain-containing protein
MVPVHGGPVGAEILTRDAGPSGGAPTRGLTLVEIIVAMTILAVVLVGMGQFAFNFSRTERQSEARTIAAALADQRLSLIRATPNYSGMETNFAGTEGTITGFPGYSRTTTIVHTGGPRPTYTTDYKTVTVTVTSLALAAPVSETVVVAAP